MKTRKIVLISILSVFTMLLTVSFRMMANPLLGKWQVNSKIEQKVQNGAVMERNEKNYKPGKKVFEFLPEGKMFVYDGTDKEKKKYTYEGSELRMGDNLYTVLLEGNKLTLSKTKTKTKEGKTTVETDELKLEKMN